MNRAIRVVHVADVRSRRRVRKAFMAWHALNVRAAMVVTRLAACLPNSRQLQDGFLMLVAFVAMMVVLFTL